MRILFIGDIFGDAGRRVLAEHLPEIKEEYSIDVTIANGENCAGGRGITGNLVKKLRKFGVDCVTGGNHSSAQPEIFADEKFNTYVLRPENASDLQHGRGLAIIEVGTYRVGVLNLLGKTFIRGKQKCPFKTADALLEELSDDVKTILVDIHAEATSEKVCLAHYLDGKVSAIVGTHTHVQTNDARIFPKGTAFITDAGMTGPEFSAIGMQHEPVLERIITGEPKQFVQSKEGPMLNAVVIDIDDESGKAQAIETIYRRYSFED